MRRPENGLVRPTGVARDGANMKNQRLGEVVIYAVLYMLMMRGQSEVVAARGGLRMLRVITGHEYHEGRHLSGIGMPVGRACLGFFAGPVVAGPCSGMSFRRS